MYEKIRASRITIEREREESPVWIHVEIQKVIKDDDDNTVNYIPKWKYHSFQLAAIALSPFNFTNKITGAEYSNNGYEVSEAIAAVVVKELQRRFNATLNAKGDLILL